MMRVGASLKILLAALSAFLHLFASSAQARELHEYYRNARTMAMGGAYLGLSDDEQTVFMNPAGLGGNQKSGIHLPFDVTASSDSVFGFGDIMSVIGDPSTDSLNRFMGKDELAIVQFTPTWILGQLGIAGIVDVHSGLMAENQALPQMNYAAQLTKGFQVAYGWQIFRKRSKRVKVRIGLAGKMLWRQGGYKTLPTSDLLNPSKESLMNRIGGTGLGYGVDLGSHVQVPVGKKLKLNAALVFTDLGDTSFGAAPQAIDMNVSAGFALQYQLKNTTASLLWDIRHLNEATDWRKRNHLGVELKFPILSLYGGYNQTFVTYGAGFNFYILRVTAASYGEETGTVAFQDPQRRWMLRVDVQFGL